MTNTREWQKTTPPKDPTRSSERRSPERHYPSADDNTAQLVRKLRSRGITDPRAAVRPTSRALIEDAYRGAEAGQTPKPFNNNYSPYSNVNMEAAEQTARRQAEARRRAEEERLRSGANAGAQKKPAVRASAPVKNQALTNTSRTAPVRKDAAKTAVVKAKSKPAVSSRHSGAGQLADSGPREVAFRRVPFPKLAFLLIIMCLVLFFMVNSIVRNYEQQRENAELREQVEEYARQAELLRSELERRDDLDAIADRADELGMIDGGMVDEKYIDLSGGDTIENFDEDDGRGSFLTTLSAMRRTLSRFLGVGGE